MTLLLASTAVLSCSMETDMQAPGNNNMESDAALKGNKVVITGVVANEDGLPLKGIHVSFLEYRENGEESMPVGSVSTLTDEEKDLIYLRYWEGYGIQEIADKLGKPLSTTHDMLKRTCKKLKQYLNTEK